MEDQRCELPVTQQNKPKAAVTTKNTKAAASGSSHLMKPPSAMQPSVSTENLFDILQRVQGNRMEGQRFQMPELPGLDPNGE